MLVLLQTRDSDLCQQFPNRKPSKFLSTFYMGFLLEKKKNKFLLSDFDKVFIPVNVNNLHWMLIVIYVETKKVVCYDSMISGKKPEYYNKFITTVENWVREEAQENQIDVSKLESIVHQKSPQQDNDFDCGVFVCICADFLSDNLPLDYSQDNMVFFRDKIAADILRGSLNYTFDDQPGDHSVRL